MFGVQWLTVLNCFTVVVPVCRAGCCDAPTGAALQTPAGGCSWGPAASGETGWSSAPQPGGCSPAPWCCRMTAWGEQRREVHTFCIFITLSQSEDTLCLEVSYFKVSSLHSALASPSESSFTSESCRSFPLRSSSIREELVELRAEARLSQHFWRLHSLNLQMETFYSV